MTQTGQELASSSLFPKMTQGILVTPGYADLQYFLTADGHIVARAGHAKTVNPQRRLHPGSPTAPRERRTT